MYSMTPDREPLSSQALALFSYHCGQHESKFDPICGGGLGAPGAFLSVNLASRAAQPRIYITIVRKQRNTPPPANV